jgi:alpha-L-fucosidase 2
MAQTMKKIVIPIFAVFTAGSVLQAEMPLEIRFDSLPKMVQGEIPANWVDDASDIQSGSWATEAQPIGNGRLGAMAFGNPLKERIQFNDITLWTGGDNPSGKFTYEEFGAYQNFGDLRIEQATEGAITDYSRSLDLTTGVHTTRWKQGDVTYTREVFATKPDDVIVVRISSDASAAIEIRAGLVDAHGEATESHEGGVGFSGQLANGMRYAASLSGHAEGGTMTIEGRVIRGSGSSITLILAAATDYVLDPDRGFRSGVAPASLIAKQSAAAREKGYQSLRGTHVKDFTAIMGRVSLDVGGPPTDADIKDRLKAYRDGAEDPHLEALMFHYGRYLLISCSRGPLPANLQGVWNDKNRPKWHSDYHTNINIQMNYWLSGPANLTECAEPLFDWILAMRPGSKAAFQKQFGEKIPGWTMRTSVNTHGGNGWKWNLPASAWLALHFWEQYAFTGDREFLRQRAWPVMTEICELWLFKLKEVDGKLVVPNGWSPEHGPLEDGVAHDQQVVWDLFTNTLEAAEVLGETGPLVDRIRSARERLYGPKIGSWGQIMEWMTERPELEKSEHRHTSHLFGLHPGRQITKLETPELFKAAAVSLEARGNSKEFNHSWTWPWRMAMWGRLERPDMAGKMMRGLLTHNTYDNLLARCPPFQIDGNLGITAGVCETLLQSHVGEIHILPAPPAQWKSGAFSGLLARRGFEVDAGWKDGSWVSARITSKLGNEAVIRLPGKLQKVGLHGPDGKTQVLQANALGQFVFQTERGTSYELKPL